MAMQAAKVIDIDPLRGAAEHKDAEPAMLPASEVRELARLSELPLELALRQAGSLLTRLARDRKFRERWLLPLLELKPRTTAGWYVAHSYNGGNEGSSCSLQVFAWPAGSWTKIHDHSCWGAFCCAVGSVVEERYERLDDGSEAYSARLKKLWRMAWGTQDEVSTVMSHDGGIHRMGNVGGTTAVSVHLYGPRVGEVDGRDYDPSRNYVCDRLES
jgi:predicted metal-dependent enzyme (double-stranded beta helix superfamily)